ncbi:fungal-specific transcription factor domain-containing protein [Aspergillus granulosus]|uniref:Fungal-specific transcription factor domain-containing protein n=1 Tax=Aspergillus granulosus TaxID=176169 RepID=A0ABR4HBP9_9EURO
MMTDLRPNPRGGRHRAACDLCRHKKIKCDNEKPACETCRLAGVPCIITQPAVSEKKSVTEQLAEAQRRIHELEDRITPQPSIRLHIRDSTNFDEAMEIFKWHLSCAGPLSLTSPQKEAFFSIIHDRTGHLFDLDAFAARVGRAYNTTQSTRSTRALVPKWPDGELMRRCIEQYADQHLYSVFPIAEPSRLNALLNEYDSSGLCEREHTVARAFLVAFTAFMTQIHRHLPAFTQAEPDCYIIAALTLLPHLILEPRNIEALQAVLIMAQYITPTGQTESGQLLLSVAIRALYNLGAHRNDPTPANTEHHTHLRALFWACYAMDKEMSIRSSQPPLINDSDCDLDLPPNYIHSTSTHQFIDRPLSGDILLYPSDLRMSLLKSKIYTHLLSPAAKILPEHRKLESIRYLDHELAELKLSFPIHFQPDPVAYLRPDYKVHDFSLRGMNIHLEYYYCLRVIHEASIVSSMTYPGAGPETGRAEPLASSVELYYHAVRSTLLYFVRVEGLVQAPTVWIHAQFILSSVMALFWNMLHTPSANTFHSDLQLLERVRRLFRRLCENCWEGAPLPPLFIFEGFLTMLVNLLNTALSRSK